MAQWQRNCFVNKRLQVRALPSAQRGIMLTDDEKEHIQAIIDNEGFEYTFVEYSRFNKVKDATFHKLRAEFIKAQRALAKYIGLDV